MRIPTMVAINPTRARNAPMASAGPFFVNALHMPEPIKNIPHMMIKALNTILIYAITIPTIQRV